MTPQATDPNEPTVVYLQGGARKTVPESQAIYMLDSIAQQDISRALSYYLKLSDENPKAERLLWKFYETLTKMHMFEELLELSSARMQRIPACAVSFLARIDALQHMFRNEEAIELLKTVAQGNPNHVSTWNTLGSYQKDVGDFNGANQSFSRAIALNPDFAPAYWNRSEFSTNPTADLEAVRKTIANNNVPTEQTHYLHFAAYRFSEKLELYDEAFEHLQIANAMKRRTFEYDVQDDIDIDNNAKTVFNEPRVRALEPALASNLRPIFIMGMPRSGTTLVEQIIASHSLVAGGDEFTAFANATMRTQQQSNFDGSVDHWLRSCQTEDWQHIGKLYEHNMRFVRGDKTVFTDKNQFNHRSIGLIKASLANAKIIIVERNPMDVAFGCYRQLFGSKGAKFSYQTDELAQFYQSYMSLVSYWESVTDGLIMRVRYEELVQNQERASKDILDFCNLAFEQNCLDFHTNKRTVKTLSASQVRQPIFTRGVGRWKQYENQLQPMLKELKKIELV